MVKLSCLETNFGAVSYNPTSNASKMTMYSTSWKVICKRVRCGMSIHKVSVWKCYTLLQVTQIMHLFFLIKLMSGYKTMNKWYNKVYQRFNLVNVHRNWNYLSPRMASNLQKLAWKRLLFAISVVFILIYIAGHCDFIYIYISQWTSS